MHLYSKISAQLWSTLLSPAGATQLPLSLGLACMLGPRLQAGLQGALPQDLARRVRAQSSGSASGSGSAGIIDTSVPKVTAHRFLLYMQPLLVCPWHLEDAAMNDRPDLRTSM